MGMDFFHFHIFALLFMTGWGLPLCKTFKSLSLSLSVPSRVWHGFPTKDCLISLYLLTIL